MIFSVCVCVGGGGGEGGRGLQNNPRKFPGPNVARKDIYGRVNSNVHIVTII